MTAADRAPILAALHAASAVASVFTGVSSDSGFVGQAAESAIGDATGIGGLY
jgi:hypothetical protein